MSLAKKMHDMSSYTYTGRITSQPQPAANLDLKSTSFEPEKGSHNDSQVHDHNCEECDGTSNHSDHRRCHNGRLRRFLVPILALFVLLGTLLAIGSCMGGHADLSGWGFENLVGRAVGDGTTNNGTFVHNKLYLIVIFVGLFVVVILAICLSAWCCRGAFENPLCCPCYLCACCGGLACLECIGCGLCAEGMDQM